jgi:hypothetical protein
MIRLVVTTNANKLRYDFLEQVLFRTLIITTNNNAKKTWLELTKETPIASASSFSEIIKLIESTKKYLPLQLIDDLNYLMLFERNNENWSLEFANFLLYLEKQKDNKIIIIVEQKIFDKVKYVPYFKQLKMIADEVIEWT